MHIEKLLSVLDEYCGPSAPRGRRAELARNADISDSGLSKIINKKVVPKIETWEKLHRAAPEVIPPVSFIEEPTKREVMQGKNEMIIEGLKDDVEMIMKAGGPVAQALAANIQAFKILVGKDRTIKDLLDELDKWRSGFFRATRLEDSA